LSVAEHVFGAARKQFLGTEADLFAAKGKGKNNAVTPRHRQ
jgi:hypothetical protein